LPTLTAAALTARSYDTSALLNTMQHTQESFRMLSSSRARIAQYYRALNPWRQAEWASRHGLAGEVLEHLLAGAFGFRAETADLDDLPRNQCTTRPETRTQDTLQLPL